MDQQQQQKKEQQYYWPDVDQTLKVRFLIQFCVKYKQQPRPPQQKQQQQQDNFNGLCHDRIEINLVGVQKKFPLPQGGKDKKA